MSEATPKQSSGLAIAGLVLGILAAATSFLPIINNLSAIFAFVGGVLALISLVGALRGKHTAKGLAIAGVVLAVVSFVVVLATQSMYAKAFDNAMSGSKPVSSSQEPAKNEAPAAEPASTDAAQAPAASSDAPADKDYSQLAVGESVTLDDGMTVTVNSVKTGLANYNDKLITCVNVTYANNGSSNGSFNTFDWKGEDAQGAQRSTAYYSDAADELSSGTLSAGGTVTGNIYFDDGIVRVLYYDNMFNKSATAGWKLQ